MRITSTIILICATCLAAGCTGESPPTGWKFEKGRNLYYNMARKVAVRSGNSTEYDSTLEETGYILISPESGESATLKLSKKEKGSDDEASVISMGFSPLGKVKVENAAANAAFQILFDIWFPLPEKELAVGESCTREILAPIGNTGNTSRGSITLNLNGYVDIRGVTCAILNSSFTISSSLIDEKIGEITQRIQGNGIAHFDVEQGCFYRSEIVAEIAYGTRQRPEPGANKPSDTEIDISRIQEEYTLFELARGR